MVDLFFCFGQGFKALGANCLPPAMDFFNLKIKILPFDSFYIGVGARGILG